MKKLFVLAFFSFLCTINAQEKFEFKKEGLTDYVVTTAPGSASEIYSKTINWIKENYKNPNDVIKMTIENEKIRFEGYKEKFYCMKAGGSVACSSAKYTIEISFKDGKYRFDPIELILYNNSGASSSVNLNDFSIYYDKNGIIAKHSQDIPKTYEDFFNGLNDNLSNYIINQKKKDEW